MKISVRSRYGLNTMIYLGINHPKKISSTIISEKLGISKIYLEQVLASLKKAELIDSEKGASGGYFLAKPPKQISTYDILYALETNLFAASKPISQIPYIESTIDNILNKIDSELHKHLTTITLDILVNQANESNTNINMYYI